MITFHQILQVIHMPLPSPGLRAFPKLVNKVVGVVQAMNSKTQNSILNSRRLTISAEQQ